MLNGKIYKTQAGGQTREVKDAELTPFAVVNFFKANKKVVFNTSMDRNKLYACLDSLIPIKTVSTLYALAESIA